MDKKTNKKPKNNLEKYLKEGGPGRPKGSINKFTELKDSFIEAFDRLGGIDGLVKWAEKSNNNRGQFYQMVTKLLPKNIVLDAESDLTVIVSKSYKPKVKREK